jgi:predicted nucleotidyltransferase
MHEKEIIRNDDDLLISRAELESLPRRFHIRRASLFGSASRGELRSDSDVDLLVEFEPDRAPSLMVETELELSFSRLFGGRSVDLVPPEILRNPFRRKTIEPDLKVLYDAT